jgi:hypothetical protein
MWLSEAAVARERTTTGSGWASGTAVTRAALATVNAVDMVGRQVSTFKLPASAR